MQWKGWHQYHLVSCDLTTRVEHLQRNSSEKFNQSSWEEDDQTLSSLKEEFELGACTGRGAVEQDGAPPERDGRPPSTSTTYTTMPAWWIKILNLFLRDFYLILTFSTLSLEDQNFKFVFEIFLCHLDFFYPQPCTIPALSLKNKIDFEGIFLIIWSLHRQIGKQAAIKKSWN